MKRVLITGGGGFIGRHCVGRLVSRGYEVHLVSPRASGNGNDQVIWHQADLLSSSDVYRVVESVKPTHLLHLAWYTEHGKFWNSRENLRWVESSAGLLHSFVRNGGIRFVGCGTGVEYDWRYGYCVEDLTPLDPGNVYGGCKLAFKSVLDSLIRSGDVDGAWGRVFFLYGPGENRERLVPSVIQSLLDGVPARATHGDQFRDFLHVEDVADGLVRLLDSEFQGAVNICSGVPVRLKEIIYRLADSLGRRSLVAMGTLPSPEGEPPLVVGSNERFIRELGWKQEYSLEEGLNTTLSWWKKETGFLNAVKEA